MDMIEDVGSVPHPYPEMGLLSRTLSSSPSTKWIIPARLRNSAKNDVVFVGDTSIQLQEFVTTTEAQLVAVTGRFTLGTPILAAKVISATAEPIPFLDQVHLQTVEEDRFVIRGEPLAEDHPPQILVLSLASCELVFVYAREQLNGNVVFQWARRPVLSGVELPDKFGRHLAIDPNSRALAFAPSMGYFAIGSLRPVDEIKTAIDSWRPTSPKTFSPCSEQHFIQVDGYIVKMDFIQSADEDPSKVILVLLVVNAGDTSLLLYRWDTRANLHHIKPMRCSGQVLPLEDSFPLMLIPCRGLASFFLVTETELVLYSQITASEAQRSAYPLLANATNPSTEPGHRFLWTQWAKPRRHMKYTSTNEDVMLIREDGLLQYFIIVHSPKPKAKISTTAGRLGFDVDTAICMLPTPHSVGGGDILIAGGNMTHGGVFHLEAKQAPRLIQSLQSATPLNDLFLLGSDTKQPFRLDERRLFASCGNKDGRGALTQIHHGLEAQIGWTIDHSDAASIEHIWTVEAEDQDTLLLLFSHSAHTSLIVFRVRTTELEFANSETHPGIEFDCPTLALASLDSDVFVQLTSNNVNILSFSDRFSAVRRNFKSTRPLCAAVLKDLGLVLVAHPTLDGFAISIIDLRKNDVDEDPFAPAIKLQDQPVSIHTGYFNETNIFFVSTEQGQLMIFTIKSDLQLAKLFDHSLSDMHESIEDSTASSACLLCYPSTTSAVLLCGLRSGYLLCISLKAITGLQFEYLNGEVHKLGSTTVSITADDFTAQQSNTSAFAICRCNVKHISLRPNNAGIDLSISSVFITDCEDRSEPQNKSLPRAQSKPFPVVNAAHRIQRLRSDPSSAMNGLLLCATPTTVLFSSIVSQTQAIFQHTPIPGVPKRLAYCKFLQQLVVGVETSSGPHLVFMTPSSNDSDQTMYQPSQSVPVGQPFERIRAIINYRPTDGVKHMVFLVIALNSTNTDPASGAQVTIGNVVCLSLKRIQRGKADAAKPHQVMRIPGKAITALAIQGDSCLLIGTENQVKLHKFDVEGRKWETLSSYDLPSAAMDIDVQGRQIFVATQKHSLMLLRESQGNLVLVEADKQARNTTNVLTLSGRRTLLASVSDKGTTVTGWSEDPRTGGLGKMFEATVPLIIDRIVEETADLPVGLRERSSFIGSTTDGTLYRFLTLKSEEWELLKLLEALYQERKGPVKRRLANRSITRHVGAVRGAPRGGATGSHVDGDALAGVVEMGSMDLRELLKPRFKEEDESVEGKGQREETLRKLRKTAAPLVGDAEDIIGAVVIWLRKILNWEVE